MEVVCLVGRKCATGWREGQDRSLAMEKWRAEVVFGRLDRVADGALRGVQLAAGLREVAAAGEADEGAELAGIDGVFHECHSYIR